MYDTTGFLPVESLAPGTALLCTGPPMVGKRAFGYRFLAAGLAAAEGAVLVTMTDAASTAREAVGAHLDAPDERVSERFHVVDATMPGAGGDAATATTHSVSSPADLTGMSIGVGNALETLSAGDVAGVRLVLDSVTTLLVYNDPDRVYRFVHDLVGRVQGYGAVGCVFADPEVAGTASQFRELFDGLVELREGAGGRELRVRGTAVDDTGWHPFDPATPAVGAAAGQPSEAGSTTPADPAPAASRTGQPVPDSLHAVIESVAADRQTLSLLNFTGGDADLETLESSFERQNVSVRTVDLPVETPADVALLHESAAPIAVAPTEALVRAVRLSETDERFDAGERPALLEYVERGGYAVDNGGKRYLVGVSRMIEERARRVGRGELHTGFQSLARLDDERGTRRMYDALAATDVDVHLYGVDDGGAADALADQFTVHPAEAAELAESWFVVFDGGGVTDAAVSLLTEERDPGRYHGFWSRDVDLTGRIVRYLETTYGG